MEDSQIKEIIYHEDFDKSKGDLIQVSDDFINYLDKESSFQIYGNLENSVILSTDSKTYRLKCINLPTSMLVISQQGIVHLETDSFLKLENYDHQYHRIYQKIKSEAADQQNFNQYSLAELIELKGIENTEIRNKFQISLEEFIKFEQFVPFIFAGSRRLYIPNSILYRFMSRLLFFITERQLYNQYFTLSDLDQFNCEIKCFSPLTEDILNIIAKKFSFDLKSFPEESNCTAEGNQDNIKKYKISFESILHLILIQMAFTNLQYKSIQMDNLISSMLNIYVPAGMPIPSEKEKQGIINRILSRYFIETTRNNNLIRVYYDPLEIESSLKGRIKFMSTFKNRFTKDEIRGIFQGIVIQDSSKQIKQIAQGVRKSIDMDDLLLKNFRKFNQLYQIKLILPK